MQLARSPAWRVTWTTWARRSVTRIHTGWSTAQSTSKSFTSKIWFSTFLCHVPTSINIVFVRRSHGEGDKDKKIPPEADFSVAFKPGSLAYVAFSKLWHRAKQWKEGRDTNLALTEDTVGAPAWFEHGVVPKVPRPSPHNLLLTGVGCGKSFRE